MKLVCDFCHSPEPVHCYYFNAISRLTFKDGGDIVLNGDYLACAVCRDLIDNPDTTIGQNRGSHHAQPDRSRRK